MVLTHRAGGESQLPQPMLLRKATAFVSRILSVMGLIDAPSDRPGVGAASSGAEGDGRGGADAAAREDAWCGAVAGVRDRLRAVAQMPEAEMKGALMELSDRCAHAVSRVIASDLLIFSRTGQTKLLA